LEHAKALCALLAQALWRLRLTSSMLSAQSEVQRQQLQSTFLAAISHDLRTPLASIVGAASALQTQRDKLSLSEQARLLGSIVSEASYLSTVTENTLQFVNLTSSAQQLRRDWESLEEIVGAVLARVRQRDPERRIKSKVPEDLPLVKVDPVLLAQLIGNLLDNALKYSDGAIDLTLNLEGQAIVVSVKDRGPGIPEAEQEAIFEPYSRSDQSGQRGAGLGLALCRAIAQAHGGQLKLRPRTGGGSIFYFTVPVDFLQPGKEVA
jgi:two-component system sensor histidine kinase KdpD